MGVLATIEEDCVPWEALANFAMVGELSE